MIEVPVWLVVVVLLYVQAATVWIMVDVLKATGVVPTEPPEWFKKWLGGG